MSTSGRVLTRGRSDFIDAEMNVPPGEPTAMPDVPTQWAPQDEEDLVRWAEQAALRLRERFENWLLPMIKPDMPAARLANIYVASRKMSDAFNEAIKILDKQVQALSNDKVPEAFERDDFKSITTNSGYRVTVSMNLRASIKAEQKEAAYQWLRANNLGNLITETVNPSTLSAAAKHELSEGRELPDHLFHAVPMPSTSVTKVK